MSEKDNKVTILILIDGFLQWLPWGWVGGTRGVTILILIDGFLQLKLKIMIICL